MKADDVLVSMPNRYVQAITRRYLRIKRPFLMHRVSRPFMERVDDFAFATIPTVFNPVVFRAGTMLGRAAERWGKSHLSDGAVALDMGCGSGVVGAYMARVGYKVTSVDINPDAVRVARANALLNDLEDRIEVLEGDLFAPVADRQYDLVCFGPPYFSGPPKDDRLSRAFWSEGLMERFARELPDYIVPGGAALVHLSTDGASEEVLDPAAEVGFDISIYSRINYGNEIMTVYALQMPAR